MFVWLSTVDLAVYTVSLVVQIVCLASQTASTARFLFKYSNCRSEYLESITFRRCSNGGSKFIDFANFGFTDSGILSFLAFSEIVFSNLTLERLQEYFKNSTPVIFSLPVTTHTGYNPIVSNKRTILILIFFVRKTILATFRNPHPITN